MKIADVARETDLNRNTVTLLYRETATRVDLEAVDKLCRLFECEVGDLFSFTNSLHQPSKDNSCNEISNK